MCDGLRVDGVGAALRNGVGVGDVADNGNPAGGEWCGWGEVRCIYREQTRLLFLGVEEPYRRQKLTFLTCSIGGIFFVLFHFISLNINDDVWWDRCSDTMIVKIVKKH